MTPPRCRAQHARRVAAAASRLGTPASRLLPGLVAAGALVLLLGPGAARGETTRVCVTVHAAAEELAGLQRLVAAELAHHPTHEPVTAGCESNLLVELFQVQQRRYLTARIDQEVPVRHELDTAAELGTKLSEALAAVLRHDPVYLSKDISRYNLLQRAANSVLKRGENRLRLDLFQSIARTGTGASFVPGVGVALVRGADQWSVTARASLGGSPEDFARTQIGLRLEAGAETGLLWEPATKAWASPYLGGGAGMQLLRFEGPSPEQAGATDIVTKLGGALWLRAGVRVLRWHDHDADLYLGGTLPLFRSRSGANLLFGEEGIWTPSVQLGLGVGF